MQEEKMGDNLAFGIISEIDPNQDYSQEFGQFSDLLKKYHCVLISDDLVNELISLTQSIPTYLFSLQKPAHGIDHYAVTLIPPESFSPLIKTIQTCRRKILRPEIVANMGGTMEVAGEQLNTLISLIQSASDMGKYVICYGV